MAKRVHVHKGNLADCRAPACIAKRVEQVTEAEAWRIIAGGKRQPSRFVDAVPVKAVH